MFDTIFGFDNIWGVLKYVIYRIFTKSSIIFHKTNAALSFSHMINIAY